MGVKWLLDHPYKMRRVAVAVEHPPDRHGVQAPVRQGGELGRRVVAPELIRLATPISDETYQYI